MTAYSSSHWKMGLAFVLGCCAFGAGLAYLGGTEAEADEATVNHDSSAALAESSILASSNEPVLEEQAESSFYPTLEGDPEFTSSPWAWDIIVNEHNSRIEDLEDSCEPEQDCWDDTNVRITFVGDRLISAVSHQDLYLGGAHGVVYVGDYLFDRKTKSRIKFGNIFVSWPKVKPLIQDRFCGILLSDRNTEFDDIECPDVNDLAFSLSNSRDDKFGFANQITIYTSDYQLGYYAAGRRAIDIPIDSQIYNNIILDFANDIEIF